MIFKLYALHVGKIAILLSIEDWTTYLGVLKLKLNYILSHYLKNCTYRCIILTKKNSENYVCIIYWKLKYKAVFLHVVRLKMLKYFDILTCSIKENQ
jgi:hypothetical protein